MSEGNVMTMLSPLGICWGDEGVGWEALDAGGGVLPSVGVAINEAVSCVLVSLIGAGFGAVATTASKVAQVVVEEGVFVCPDSSHKTARSPKSCCLSRSRQRFGKCFSRTASEKRLGISIRYASN